ncbi:hypothetical protein TWF694_002930 [Orbilia ellipsospora]|uniref:Uncharacterized protein n=1 Tax=Orbilia ellipsospora TaxID=2528407 RepID=A0AAV9X191_9PEZI
MYAEMRSVMYNARDLMGRKVAFSGLLSLGLLLSTSQATNLEQQPLDKFPTITAAPDIRHAKGLLPRQGGQYACEWVSTVFEQCSTKGYNKVGGISGLPYCACYPEAVYDPNQVDGYIQQCYQYEAANAAFEAQFTSFLGMCHSAGDIRATLMAGYTACSEVSSISSFCSANGYNKVAGPSALAGCACYSTGIYRPDIFDGLFSSCLSYAETADTSLAKAIYTFDNYCSNAGDVRQEISSGSSICTSIINVINSCSRWNQFITGDQVEKASFFCYDAYTNFIGSSRDRSAQQCYTFATEYWPEVINTVSSLQFICSQVGDVRALYPGGSSGGGGGGGGSGDDGVPSPQPTSSIPSATSSPGGSNGSGGGSGSGGSSPGAGSQVTTHPAVTQLLPSRSMQF